MKCAVVIQHVLHEDLDGFEPILRSAGYEIERVCAASGRVAHIDPLEPDLLVLLGGPLGVYQTLEFPFLERELALLRKRLPAGGATLGICLGCQLMARALGARVYRGEAGAELGFGALELTTAGAAGALHHLGSAPVLHWHGDTFDIPAGAERLAGTPRYPNQAFSYGQHALGLQFHPEVSARSFERWLVASVGEISATPGVTVNGLRGAAASLTPALLQRGGAMLTAWLAQLPTDRDATA